jgi:hypothetical protein
MINALMNVASVQHKPKNGLLLAKDGKLPEYRDGKGESILKILTSPF